MPAATPLNNTLDRQLLIQLGQRLRQARKAQGVTTTQMADRAGIARMTLASVEAGEPSATMGTYVRVMSALGLSGDLVLLASGARQADGQAPMKKVQARAANHDVQDLQSLMLHEEAVAMLKKEPALIAHAQETLEKWRATGNSSSRVLWDEWSVILHRRDWRRALARTRRSNELRQASPLPVLLPPETRARVLDQVRQLKEGVDLAAATPGQHHAVDAT
ncbi:helix-turn-helix transcriptional regulator [Polaromonas sp. YR568]|uniref:helix-turn-helix domain-containing protein n=1 Tax=Polaromonas sp. YR568 TaxID=1855301 RepID=UPI003137FD7C